MATKSAAKFFAKKTQMLMLLRFTCIGSLAETGKGHMTDYIIKKTLAKPTEIIWKFYEELPLHPNGMILEAYLFNKKIDDCEIFGFLFY